MKLLSKFLLVSSLLLLTRCSEDLLDLDPTVPTAVGFYQDDLELEQGVLGAYAKLVFYHNYVENTVAMLHGVRLFPDDDLTSEGNIHPYDFFSGITADEDRIERYYDVTNQLVNRANTMLEVVRDRTDAYTDENLQQAHIGELLFLRAYAYYTLFSFWENAPLLTEPVRTLTEAQVPNSNGTELLDQAILDLRESAMHLSAGAKVGPDDWGSEMKGRVTAGSANALLGKILVTRANWTNNPGDFSEAITALDAISAYRLVENFSDNFRPGTENNEESLFEIQLGASQGVETNFWLNSDQFGNDGDASGFWGFFEENALIWGAPVWVPSTTLIDAFPVEDPRRRYTISEDGSAVRKYVFDEDGAVEFNEDWGIPAKGAYYNNSRVIRYADVLLLKAEAILESGGSTAQSIALINQVRARARNSSDIPSATPMDRDINETDRNIIFQWIMEERRLELAFEEGNRWQDLRRWHKAGKINLATWDFGSLNPQFSWTERNLNLPFPASERERNLELRPTPGWD